jgi:hypothetical protein
MTRPCASWAWELASSVSPVALWRFWGLQNKRPVNATQPASPILLQPPGAAWGRGTACSPFALVQGAGGHGMIGAGSHTDGLGTPSRGIRDLDPAEGVPTAGLANRHATVIEGRQLAKIAVLSPGSSQSAGMSWGSIRDSGTKVSPVIPLPGVPVHPRTGWYPARATSYQCRSGR